MIAVPNLARTVYEQLLAVRVETTDRALRVLAMHADRTRLTRTQLVHLVAQFEPRLWDGRTIAAAERLLADRGELSPAAAAMLAFELGLAIANARTGPWPADAPGREPWYCKRCGSTKWVGWRRGPEQEVWPQRAQCVPCGRIQEAPRAVPAPEPEPAGDSPAWCAAAHADDSSSCEWPFDAVRVVDRAGAEITACVEHAATLLASLEGGRVYPGSIGGAAVEAYQRAQGRRPFGFGAPR